MIIVNTPQNCPGKVYTKRELEQIAKLAIEHNLIVLSDDCYEAMIYDNVEFVKFATLPGMWERTITIGSAGKTFCVTGWKIGWVIANRTLRTRTRTRRHAVAHRISQSSLCDQWRSRSSR